MSRRPSPRAADAWAFVALAALAGAGPSGPGAFAGSDAPVASVTPLEGPVVKGALVGVDDAGVRLEGVAQPVALRVVREMRLDAKPAPADPALSKAPRVRVVLRGNETLKGSVVGGSADALEIEAADLPRTPVPFDHVLRVEAEAAHVDPCSEPGRKNPARPGRDVVYSTTGDAVMGSWIDASAEGIVMEASGRKTRVAWGDLLVLHVDEAPLPASKDLVADVDTVGGSRLLATSVQGDASTLSVTTRSGLVLRLPTRSVSAVRWSGGAFVYASDLEFESEVTPFMRDSENYPRWYATRVDRTQDGCPLRLGGVTYRHGFWTHSKSRVRIPLGKAYKRFEAKVGLDDVPSKEAPSPLPPKDRGDVTVRVLVDGKEAWTSGGSVKGGEPARAVGPVDVSGASVLELEVGFGENTYVNDACDWVDPILVK
jgi:hypothetical protein